MRNKTRPWVYTVECVVIILFLLGGTLAAMAMPASKLSHQEVGHSPPEEFFVPEGYYISEITVPGTTMMGPPAGATTVNVGDLAQTIASYIGDAGALLVAALVAWIGKHVKNEYARKALTDGVTRGAKGVYEAIVAEGKSVQNIDVKNAKIADAVHDLTALFPVAMKTFDLTSQDLHNMVRKELGGLLAVDPTVTITPAQGVPANPSDLKGTGTAVQTVDLNVPQKPMTAAPSNVPASAIVLALCASFALSACVAAPGASTASNVVTSAQTAVYDFEKAYGAVAALEIDVMRAAPITVDTIKAADNKVYGAIVLLRQDVAAGKDIAADMTMAQQALGQLTTLVKGTGN